MPLLTQTQRERVGDLIQLHHQALIIELLGSGAVSKSVLTKVKAQGLYRKPKSDVIRRALQFGSEGISDVRVLKMSSAEFDRYLIRKGAELTREERETLEILRTSLAGYMKSLADAMESKLGQSLVKADRTLQRQLSQRQRRSLFLEVERRKAIASIAKDLGQITETQLGNAARIVSTETNNAYQDGCASGILRKAGGGDPLVFKRPREDRCEECAAAYLEDDGVTPKVFRLSELMDNGSNIGKSKADRLPVLESLHPWCFPAGTRVLTARGEVPIETVTTQDLVWTHLGRWRRVVQLHENSWAGQLVNVNGTLSTPSHPFLTGRGWVPAEALQRGDDLIYAGRDVISAVAKQRPPVPFQVGSLHNVLSPLSGRVVPVSAVDFNGEPVLSASEVHVEALDTDERRERQSLCPKHRQERLFKVRQTLRRLDRLGSVDALGKWLLTSAPSFVGGAHARHLLLSTYLGVHVQPGFAGGSPHESSLAHVSHNGVSVAVEQPRHFQHGTFFSVVESAKDFLGEVFSLHRGNLATTEHHRYTERASVLFSGKVYNLSVWGDESYVAGGKVVHNCACATHWLPPGFGFDENGTMVYVGTEKSA